MTYLEICSTFFHINPPRGSQQQEDNNIMSYCSNNSLGSEYRITVPRNFVCIIALSAMLREKERENLKERENMQK